MQANLAFGKKLVGAVGGLLGPKTWLVTSSTASSGFLQKAKKQVGASMHCLRDGLPAVSASDICVVLAPSVQKDYESARQLASMCKGVILVNGFAKVCVCVCVCSVCVFVFVCNNGAHYSYCLYLVC